MGLVAFLINLVYVVLGYAAFITCLVLKNHDAAIWNLVVGIISSVSAHLTWLDYKSRLKDWYGESELKPIFWGGFCIFAISTSGLVYYVATEVVKKRPFLPIDESIILLIICAFFSMKSGVILMYTTHKYRQDIVRDSLNENLVPSTSSNTDSTTISADD